MIAQSSAVVSCIRVNVSCRAVTNRSFRLWMLQRGRGAIAKPTSAHVVHRHPLRFELPERHHVAPARCHGCGSPAHRVTDDEVVRCRRVLSERGDLVRRRRRAWSGCSRLAGKKPSYRAAPPYRPGVAAGKPAIHTGTPGRLHRPGGGAGCRRPCSGRRGGEPAPSPLQAVVRISSASVEHLAAGPWLSSPASPVFENSLANPVPHRFRRRG